MRPLVITAVFVTSMCLRAEGPYNHDHDGAGPVEWFHQALHYGDRPELYLVCAYKISVQKHGIDSLAAQGWEELLISCTVVDVIRGPKKVGEKFTYRRYLDGKAKDLVKIEDHLGRLNYVFFVEAPNGSRFVDPQDPSAVWRFEPEIQKAANLHRNSKAEQGVAPQSATRAESEPESSDKPQPDSESRSR